MQRGWYFRIGELPRDGKSKIYRWDSAEHVSRSVIGEEIGVSAYEMDYAPAQNKWKIYLPEANNVVGMDTIRELFRAFGDGEKKAYVIRGNRIGTGMDGEPLLSDVKIVSEVADYNIDDFIFTRRSFKHEIK